MTLRRFLTATLGLAFALPVGAWAQSAPPAPSPAATSAATPASMPAMPPVEKLSPKPLGAETAFVDAIRKDLTKRFPTPATAEKAGYIRYTYEDETGAVSYANTKWTSTDPKHPSQLWYDVHGRLLGADFSVLQADSPQPPHLWGVQPGRWTKDNSHVHFGLVGPGGALTFGGIGAKKFVAAGGDEEKPTAAALVAAGVAKRPEDVKFVFHFPAIWDLIVWVLPNPEGAFAEANPNVKPEHPRKGE